MPAAEASYMTGQSLVVDGGWIVQGDPGGADLAEDTGDMIPGRFNLADHCVGHAARAVPGKAALLVVDDVDRPETAERWTYQALDLAVRRIAGGLLAEGLLPEEFAHCGFPTAATSPWFSSARSRPASCRCRSRRSSPQPRPLSCWRIPQRPRWSMAAAAAAGHVPARCMVLGEAELARLKAATPLPTYADDGRGPGLHDLHLGHRRRSRRALCMRSARCSAGYRCIGSWQGHVGPADVMLHAGAFNWSYTLGVGLLDPWANGATAVLYTGPRDIAGLAAADPSRPARRSSPPCPRSTGRS